MANYYLSQSHTAPLNNHSSYGAPKVSSHSHHPGRSRRSARFANTQPQQRHRHTNRNAKEVIEVAFAASFRTTFEAARSFDLEDDEIFCPWHLLTHDDLQSIHSSSSDRSSMSSGSPDSSPLQHQLLPTPQYSIPSISSAHMQSTSFKQSSSSQLKLHQPAAQRIRNAIPIVDPNSRTTSSPPLSVSPARQIQKSFGIPRW